MELYERERALVTLAGRLDAVRRGEGQVVLIAGEAGIGKSALISRFLASAATGVDVMRGACDALFTPRPLGPLRDIALGLGAVALDEFDAQQDRHAVFSTVLGRLESHAGPAIVVFEDVHWADEATLDLIKYLGRRIAPLPVLFVLSYRDDEIGPRHPLRTVFGDLPAQSTTRLALDRLSEHAVATLVAQARHPVDPAQLFAMTGGNPFFVTEVLAGDGSSLSPTLRDAVLARAARLVPAARLALDTAALSPLPAELWWVEACIGEAVDALDECVASGMLVYVGTTYAFRHELARLAILDALSPPKRRESNARLMRVLESRAGDAGMLSRLAHHAAEAGDAIAILKYAPSAGRRAGRRTPNCISATGAKLVTRRSPCCTGRARP